MSDTLKIAQADARKNPVRMPQERRSGSRPTSRSPQVRARISSRESSVASIDMRTFRADEEGVDADVPVDAKNASTSDFENCRQFCASSNGWRVPRERVPPGQQPEALMLG